MSAVLITYKCVNQRCQRYNQLFKLHTFTTTGELRCPECGKAVIVMAVEPDKSCQNCDLSRSGEHHPTCPSNPEKRQREVDETSHYRCC